VSIKLFQLSRHSSSDKITSKLDSKKTKMDPLLDKIYFQINVFTRQKVFSELGIIVFLRTVLKISRHFLFYRFETNQMSKKESITLVFEKYLVVSFRNHSRTAFSMFLEDILTLSLCILIYRSEYV
jgi:hypothetical protein